MTGLQQPTECHPHHAQALLINTLISLWALILRIFIALDAEAHSLLNQQRVLIPSECSMYVVSSLTRWSRGAGQERSKKNK